MTERAICLGPWERRPQRSLIDSRLETGGQIPTNQRGLRANLHCSWLDHARSSQSDHPVFVDRRAHGEIRGTRLNLRVASRARVERTFRADMAQAIKAARTSIGWSQRRLADQLSISQTLVWMAEARVPGVSLRSLFAMCDALGMTIEIDFGLPLIARSARQHDGAHARCVSYVQRRLERDGWLVAREVEVVHGRSHGWIDVLALHPATGLVLVSEIKTDLNDIGSVERQLGWYEREAWATARRLGWRPQRVSAWLLLLATQANDERVRTNRQALSQSFPSRGAQMADGIGRGLALIDPSSRRRNWLIRTAADGGGRSLPIATMPTSWPGFGRRRLVAPREHEAPNRSSGVRPQPLGPGRSG
jgi:transcriptional regulator with XRE-family HTH domain